MQCKVQLHRLCKESWYMQDERTLFGATWFLMGWRFFSDSNTTKYARWTSISNSQHLRKDPNDPQCSYKWYVILRLGCHFFYSGHWRHGITGVRLKLLAIARGTSSVGRCHDPSNVAVPARGWWYSHPKSLVCECQPRFEKPPSPPHPPIEGPEEQNKQLPQLYSKLLGIRMKGF